MTNSGEVAAAAEASAQAGGEAVAIVAGHGDFAAGVVSAVAQITGRGALLVPVTNRGLGAGDIEAVLRDAAAAGRVRVIFTDLPAGSCTIAARRLLRERPDLSLVTGANLPTVLDYVLAADCADASTPDADSDASQRLVHAVERGRGALMQVGPPKAPGAPSAAPTSPRETSGPEVGGAD
jgi:PTS system N-acetylgalactosamine-specific IIA component